MGLISWIREINDNWESYCNGCGLCCYEKDRKNGKYIINLHEPCEFLGTDKRCTVYNERFKVCKECQKLTIFHALFTSYLPPSCGYVQKFRFWRKRGEPKVIVNIKGYKA